MDFFFLIIRRPPSTPLFPSPALFRSLAFLPPHLTHRLYTGFVQDELTLATNRLYLTVGSKIEHNRSEEHTSELQSRQYLVCRLLLDKKTKRCGMTRSCTATRSRPAVS